MLKFRAILSLSIKSPLRTQQLINFSSDDKKSQPPNIDENMVEKSPLEIEQKQKLSAAEKLNKLLASMETDNHFAVAKKIEIPIAGGGKKKKEKLKAIEKEKNYIIKNSEDIIEAAKNVANIIDGDKEQKKQTESELLAKLLNHIDGGSNRTIKDDAKINLDNISLNDLIVSMKVDREKKSLSDISSTSTDYQLTRSQFVRDVLDGKRSYQQQSKNQIEKKFQDRRIKLTETPAFTGSVNLFGLEPLGIFKKPNELRDPIDLLSTWTLLKQKELKLIKKRSAKNYFEKIAKWTDDCKVWRFPINNEQGMEIEEEINFSDHIFLEQHLENWCPNKGPIRHFMELICVGLSKNSYITAAEKRDHILWYRDYFAQKKHLLKDLIATTETAQKDNKQKSFTSS